MIGFPEKFQTGEWRVNAAWIDITLADGTVLNYDETRVMLNGFVRDTSTTVDGEFTVGAAVTTKLTVVLDNFDDELSQYDFRDAVMIAWLGGKNLPVLTDGLHPDADVTEDTEITITGLTADQLEYFVVGAGLDFGSMDGDHDDGRTFITAVSTVSGVTTITLNDAVTITTDTYISVTTTEKVNYGRYYVGEYTYDGANITLTAYDDMCKFDVPCSTHYPNGSWRVGQLYAYAIANNCCSAAGVNLYNSLNSFPNPGIAITQSSDFPNQWDTMTLHDLISYIAQVCCCYAHIVYVPNPGDYRLKFEWYDVSNMNADQYDGGTFLTTTTPYSDGADLDGGDFTYDDSEDSADGGTFGDRTGIHIVPAPYDLTVDTDDVLITGVTVTLDPSDNIYATEDTKTYAKTIGTDGYIIQISGNPLIRSTASADKACDYLYNYLNGMRFRSLSASVPENPSMEAGDVAYVNGRNGNTYSCFFSRVTYTTAAATSISCDAASTMQNLKGRYSSAQKTQALINRSFQKSVSDAESAMSGILGALATTMGLYDISETQADGSIIYQFGDASTKAASTKIWRFTAGALIVSNDGGVTWSAALSANGIAVLQELYSVKVNADFVETGTLTVGGTSKGVGIINVKDNSDNIIGIVDTNGIYYGKTSISDTTHTGFFLASNGFNVGNASDDVYFRVEPNLSLYGNLITIKDNPAIVPGTLSTTFSITSSYGTTNLGSAYCSFGGDVDIEGDLDVDGSKNRLVRTADYGKRRLSAYETAEPTFGDIGEGIIGEDGKCYVDIDPILSETICTEQYQVFVQAYGNDNLYVSERTPTYFIVCGTSGTAFGWEMKARQKDFQNKRLEEKGLNDFEGPQDNSDLDYISLLEEELYGGLPA